MEEGSMGVGVLREGELGGPETTEAREFWRAALGELSKAGGGKRDSS
jgi:hypothetical protein